MNAKKIKTDYLSYSRAYSFITDKWDFVRTYILKENERDKDNKFKRMHKLIKYYYTDRDKIVRQTNNTTKDLKEFYKKFSDKFYVTKSEDSFLKKFKDFIDMDYNQDIKSCLVNGVHEAFIQDDKKKIRGELDCADSSIVLDFKGEPISSLRTKKLKYGLQAVIYKYLYIIKTKNENMRLYFLSLPLVYPYSFARFTFPSIWIDGVRDLFFKKIYPNYMEYVENLKKALGNNVFTKHFTDKKEVLNILNKNKLLSVDFEITPNAYELRDLDIMMVGDKHKEEFF